MEAEPTCAVSNTNGARREVEAEVASSAGLDARPGAVASWLGSVLPSVKESKLSNASGNSIAPGYSFMPINEQYPGTCSSPEKRDGPTPTRTGTDCVNCPARTHFVERLSLSYVRRVVVGMRGRRSQKGALEPADLHH
jgi:hypothetical protein